ncbi:MAG: NAD(P)-dependent glycerol-3-phosphate dehydrogenase [Candidatus Omnitrophica bacterium]|nr:NAD(P)-dependent glycerol-3-phosphate dehydrogenase [Candidatus Omnitrophota bacterium]
MAAASQQRVAVLGDGGWGTTLAIHLHHQGHRVALWGAFPDYVLQLRRRRRNVKFLPGIHIPRAIVITDQLADAVAAAQLVVFAVPSPYVRAVVRRLRPLRKPSTPILSVGKGLEGGTLQRLSEVLTQELGRVPLAVLSGPNVAAEMARGRPASSVVASCDPLLARQLQRLLMSPQLRIYTSTDVLGVELGGALKNPIAIASGIADGLQCGANAKAALITRGIAEMARLGVALGAKPQTFWGLSGLGDLVTTCLAGRNHWLGEQLGHGKTLRAILASTPMVMEGVETCRAAVALGRRRRVELPIIEQVHAVLFRGRAPRQALEVLMARAGTAEFPRG